MFWRKPEKKNYARSVFFHLTLQILHRNRRRSAHKRAKHPNLKLFGRWGNVSAIYDLHTSRSKLVTVCFELVNGHEFEVAIKFVGRHAAGISLNVAEWAELREQMTIITPWFKADEGSINDRTPNMSPLRRQKISFMTSYNKKAISLEVMQTEKKNINGEQQRIY